MKSKNDEFKSELETQYSILIKATKNEQRIRTIIIFVVLLLTFISTIFTTYLSYKTYKETKRETISKTKTIKYYQTLETTYQSTPNLNFTITNGFNLSEPFVFTITNNGDTNIVYNINISSVQTNLAINDNLHYTIAPEGEKTINNLLPLTNQTLLENITIEPNQSKKYKMTVSFNGYIDGTAEYKSIIKVEQQKNVSSINT